MLKKLICVRNLFIINYFPVLYYCLHDLHLDASANVPEIPERFPRLQQLIEGIQANMPEIPGRINDFIDRNIQEVRDLTTRILDALYGCPGKNIVN